MSDARRRELERAARAGDPDAAARLLAEQQRAGELGAEEVRRRAAIGDPAARRALALPPPRDAAAWAEKAAAAAGPWPALRGLAAAARRALGDDRTTPLRRGAARAVERALAHAADRPVDELRRSADALRNLGAFAARDPQGALLARAAQALLACALAPDEAARHAPDCAVHLVAAGLGLDDLVEAFAAAALA